jgi:hypothetical protein
MAALLGATVAGINAGLHHVVIVHRLATFRASLTSIRAHAANLGVKLRFTQHKVGTRDADLGAVREDTDVTCLGMSSAFLQTVLNGLNAGGMAV